MKLLAYRESTHAILSVTCPYIFILCVTRLYKILVYSILEHINITSMYFIDVLMKLLIFAVGICPMLIGCSRNMPDVDSLL